jgi:hypothetical protein
MRIAAWMFSTIVAAYLVTAIAIAGVVVFLGGGLLTALAVGFYFPFKMLFGK